MSTPPDPNPDDVHDEASFLRFVAALAADRRSAAQQERSAHPQDAVGGWQNRTIESFLDGAFAWAQDSDFGRTQGLSEDVSPWRRMAVFLFAGKIYE